MGKKKRIEQKKRKKENKIRNKNRNKSQRSFFEMKDLQRCPYDWSSSKTSQWTQTCNWVDGVAESQGGEIRAMAVAEKERKTELSGRGNSLSGVTWILMSQYTGSTSHYDPWPFS